MKEFILNNYLTKSKTGNFYKKKVDIFIDCEEIPESLKMFAEKYKLSINPQPRKHYDLAIALDCLNKERMGKYITIFDRADKKINLDHHISNSKFGDYNYVFKLSSTCESLYSIFCYFNKNFGTSINKYILNQIYAGIITDTNNLENNADKLITRHHVSAIINDLGVRQASVIKAHFFQNIPKTKLALVSYSYQPNVRRHYNDGKICIITLDNKIFAKTKASLEDAEGIVDSALKTEGVLVSALILENEKGVYNVKLRGKGIKVNDIAQVFGGGGHEYMAGFQTKMKYNILNMALLRECRKTINEKFEEDNTLENIL